VHRLTAGNHRATLPLKLAQDWRVPLAVILSESVISRLVEGEAMMNDLPISIFRSFAVSGRRSFESRLDGCLNKNFSLLFSD